MILVSIIRWGTAVAKIKTADEADRNRVRGSLRTFLEGSQDLKWFLRVIRNSGVERTTIVEIFGSLRDHGDRQRYEDVMCACRQEGLLP